MPEKNPRLIEQAHFAKIEVEALLSQHLDQLPELPTQLAEAMQYSLLGGGKRMRPLLCFLVGDVIDAEQHAVAAIAAAIECIHAYSLIHDDLPAMDNDDTRRGKPTSHIKYGEATAILAGDALQSMAYEFVVSDTLMHVTASTKVKLVQLLSSASGYAGMCGGQAIDLAATGINSEVPHTLDTLYTLHRLKTGALLKACVTMPLQLVNHVNDGEIAAFNQFADAIGLAFQVQDDILDEIGSDDQLGKPQGSDSAQNKHTFPALLGLDGAKTELEKLYKQALQALESLPYNTQALVAYCDLLIHRDH